MEDIHRPDPLSSFPISEAPQRRALTRKELLASFQFSQGDPVLQNRIVQYLKYLHPELAMTVDEESNLFFDSEGPADAIVNNPHRHRHQAGAREIGLALADAIEEVRLIVNGNDVVDKDLLVRDLVERIVAADLSHLQRKSGRNYSPSATGHYNPYKDPWRSDLCYFGVLGNTTGLSDFDQLFQDVACLWQDRRHEMSESAVENAKRVIRIFNRHHTQLRVHAKV